MLDFFHVNSWLLVLHQAVRIGQDLVDHGVLLFWEIATLDMASVICSACILSLILN